MSPGRVSRGRAWRGRDAARPYRQPAKAQAAQWLIDAGYRPTRRGFPMLIGVPLQAPDLPPLFLFRTARGRPLRPDQARIARLLLKAGATCLRWPPAPITEGEEGGGGGVVSRSTRSRPGRPLRSTTPTIASTRRLRHKAWV